MQHETLGHRGHEDDPLYQVRRLLRRGVETLSGRQRHRLETALQIGDPTFFHVTIAGQAAQRLRAAHHVPNLEEGRQRALAVLNTPATCPVPESAGSAAPCSPGRPSSSPPSPPAAPPPAPTEAINLLIERSRRDAHGFRNFHTYRLRLLPSYGATWKTPSTAQIRTRHPRLVA